MNLSSFNKYFFIKKSYPDYHIENKTYFIVKKNYFWNKIDKYRLYSREYNKLGEKVCNIETIYKTGRIDCTHFIYKKHILTKIYSVFNLCFIQIKKISRDNIDIKILSLNKFYKDNSIIDALNIFCIPEVSSIIYTYLGKVLDYNIVNTDISNFNFDFYWLHGKYFIKLKKNTIENQYCIIESLYNQLITSCNYVHYFFKKLTSEKYTLYINNTTNYDKNIYIGIIFNLITYFEDYLDFSEALDKIKF